MIAERVGEKPGGEESSLMLEARVREALQPLLVNFRQEVAQAVQLQVERIPRAEVQEVQPAPPAQDRTGDEQSEPSPEHAPVAEAEQLDTVRGALAELTHGLERQVERRLPSLVEAGLRALFSEAAKAAIQRQSEQALHAGMDRGFELLPEGAVSQALERELKQVIQAILQEVLDSIFGGPIRTELDNHGPQALQALLQGDAANAQKHIREVFARAADEVLTILQRHRTDAIGIAIRVLTKASEQMVATKVEEGVAEVTSGTVESVEKGREAMKEKAQEYPEDQSEPVEEKLEDRGQDIRGHLSNAADTLRQQVEEEARGLKQHLKEGVQSGTKEGTRSRQFGRPPSVHPPSRGSTLGRHPSRRSPPGRPPSARSRSS